MATTSDKKTKGGEVCTTACEKSRWGWCWCNTQKGWDYCTCPADEEKEKIRRERRLRRQEDYEVIDKVFSGKMDSLRVMDSRHCRDEEPDRTGDPGQLLERDYIRRRFTACLRCREASACCLKAFFQLLYHNARAAADLEKILKNRAKRMLPPKTVTVYGATNSFPVSRTSGDWAQNKKNIVFNLATNGAYDVVLFVDDTEKNIEAVNELMPQEDNYYPKLKKGALRTLHLDDDPIVYVSSRSRVDLERKRKGLERERADLEWRRKRDLERDLAAYERDLAAYERERVNLDWGRAGLVKEPERERSRQESFELEKAANEGARAIRAERLKNAPARAQELANATQLEIDALQKALDALPAARSPVKKVKLPAEEPYGNLRLIKEFIDKTIVPTKKNLILLDFDKTLIPGHTGGFPDVDKLKKTGELRGVIPNEEGIAQLKDLHEEKQINEEEYERAKDKILARTTQWDVPGVIPNKEGKAQLKDLHEKIQITKEKYERAKDDILDRTTQWGANEDHLQKLGVFLNNLLKNEAVDVAIVTRGIEKSGTKQGPNGPFQGVQEVINYVLYKDNDSEELFLRTVSNYLPTSCAGILYNLLKNKPENFNILYKKFQDAWTSNITTLYQILNVLQPNQTYREETYDTCWEKLYAMRRVLAAKVGTLRKQSYRDGGLYSTVFPVAPIQVGWWSQHEEIKLFTRLIKLSEPTLERSRKTTNEGNKADPCERTAEAKDEIEKFLRGKETPAFLKLRKDILLQPSREFLPNEDDSFLMDMIAESYT